MRKGRCSIGAKQRRHRNAKRVSDLREVTYRRVSHALLDAPEVGAMHARLFGKVFLRPTLVSTQLSNSLAERLGDGIHEF